MRERTYFAGCVVILLTMWAACSRPTADRQYTLVGQILSISADHREATIKHEEVKGFMPAMTMPYKMKEPRLLDGIAPGDLVSARLVVLTNEAYLDQVNKTGSAPLEPPPPAPSASSGFELLKPGETIPATAFIDENGKNVDFGAFKGSTVVLTFIYTRCPMPDFCPLMDRNFIAVQKQLKSDAALARRVHLVSVSFDPLNDTPPVLKAHAKALDADPALWTFLTGDRDDIDRFAARFGVSIERAMNDQSDITHNLRTAIVDGNGKVVKVYTGNEWTPRQILDDLRGL